MKIFLKLLSTILLSSASVIAHAAPNQSAVILQYHHVSDSTPAVTSVTPENFKRHIDYLSENEFNVLPLKEVVEALQKNQSLPEKTIAITFDDAYLNIYENAFPLLKEKGWPFTLFVATDPVDKKYQRFLSWEQIREMTPYGATIANHTTKHDHSVERLPGETEQQWIARFKNDLDTTEQRIKDKTGQSVKLFAWTFGETAPQLRQQLADMGYVGFGQQSGAAGSLSDFTRLPRYPMAGNYGGSDFALKVNSLALPVKNQSPDSSIINENNLMPELVIELAEGEFQKKQLKCYASGQGEIEVQWLNKEMTQFKTRVKNPLPTGRSRYNCTAPSNSGRQYYWYSHAWLRLTDEGKALD